MNDMNVIDKKSLVKPTMALDSYFAKKRRSKIIAIVLILLGLAALLWIWMDYYTARAEPLPKITVATANSTVSPPAILFAISGGPGDLALKEPLDVATHPNGNIFVTSRTEKYGTGRVEAFTPNGDFLFAFQNVDEGTLKAPVSVAINESGKVFVSDVRRKAVYVFTDKGRFVSKLLPNGEKDFSWNPVGLAFDDRDNLYVTDTFSEHQVIVLSPDGKIKFKFGSTASATKKGDYKGKFFFPNDVTIDNDGNHIFVADSNNRRVQVFSMTGKYERVIETAGLPRGIVLDNKARLYVVDALGHDVSVFKKTAPTNPTALATFGGQGVELGQMLYPNGLTTTKDGRRILVADRENDRVDVFEWPANEQSAGAAVAKTIPLLALLIPFGLSLTWLYGSRRRYFADRHFLDNVIEHNHMADLKKKAKKVFVAPDVYEAFKGYQEGDLKATDVLSVIDPNKEAVKAASRSHNLNAEVAVLFAGAQRGIAKPRILTEIKEAHLAALDSNIESMDHDLFIEYYGLPRKGEERKGKK